jgi:anaerobic selenocysteine-containing dehydrogenase
MVVRMGGNPLMSEPNSVARAYTPLSACSLLVCIDIFMNETGQLADVTRPV